MSNFNLIEAEDEFLLNKLDLRISRPGLYPSEASVAYEVNGRKIVLGKCLREAWYRSMGIDGGCVTPKLAMTGRLGKAAERDTIDRWKSMGIWGQNNVKFFNRHYYLSGELDAVIRAPDGELILQEIKTFYGYYAQREVLGSKRPPIPGKPKTNQFLQTVLYHWEYKDQIDDHRMYYLERGDGTRVSFRVGTIPNENGTHSCYWEQLPCKYWNFFSEGKKICPYTIEDIHQRYTDLANYLKQKVLPPKDYEKIWSDDKVIDMKKEGHVSESAYKKWQKNKKKDPIGNWECNWCKYSVQCQQDEMTSAIK